MHRGFQFLLILDLWGISFLVEVVFGLGKNLLFKSALGHCGCIVFSRGAYDLHIEVRIVHQNKALYFSLAMQ